MAKTNFENAKSFLKAHPGAQLITRRRGRNAASDPAPTESPIQQPAFDRHRRKCQICHHPYRDEIEADYLHWRSSTEIAKEFGIADHSAVCRHARATGLRDQRQRTVAYALEPILEQAEDAFFLKTTASNIVSAVRAYSQINDQGRRLRTKPVTNIYITNESGPGTAPPNLNDLQFVPGLKQLSRRLSGPQVSGFSAVDVSRHSSLATSHCLKSNRPNPGLEDDSTY